MTTREQNTSIVSTMWLMVSIIPQAGWEPAEAVNLVPGGPEIADRCGELGPS